MKYFCHAEFDLYCNCDVSKTIGYDVQMKIEGNLFCLIHLPFAQVLSEKTNISAIEMVQSKIMETFKQMKNK